MVLKRFPQAYRGMRGEREECYAQTESQMLAIGI